MGEVSTGRGRSTDEWSGSQQSAQQGQSPKATICYGCLGLYSANVWQLHTDSVSKASVLGPLYPPSSVWTRARVSVSVWVYVSVCVCVSSHGLASPTFNLRSRTASSRPAPPPLRMGPT